MIRKVRFWLLFAKTYFSRYKFRVSIVFLMVVGLCLILINFEKHPKKATISEGLVGTYTEKDLPVVVTSLISRGLVKVGGNDIVLPDLASSWQVNKEGNEYTLKLNKDLVWSDGRPLVVMDMALPIPEVEISYPGSDTVKFKLADSFSPFPSLLLKPVLRKDSNIGVGPYRITRVENSSVFVKKLELTTNDPTLPNLTIRFYPNEKTAGYALKSGEVASLLGVANVSDFAGQRPFELFSNINHSRVVTIFYNTKDPILSDENFRLALSFAAPAIKGQEEAKTSIPIDSWAFNSEVKDYLDNPKMAKSYLAKVKHGLEAPIVLTVTNSLQDVGERVVESWNNQGIKAVLRVESGIPQNFQALLIAQNIPFDPDQYSLWHGTQSETNISKISLPRVDKDLEDGRKTVDLEQRKALYKDFQKTLLDHAPATFLYFPKNNVVYLKKIEAPLKKVLDLQLNNL